MSVKPSPAAPVAAATLVLLRDRPGGGVEALLIQRHLQSRFAAGDFVFPGGKVEVDDTPDDAGPWCAGLSAGDAAHRLGPDAAPSTALGYWVGAIREAFEEVGVLLAYGPGGRPARGDGPRFADDRRACQRDHRAFWAMVRREGLALATDRLTYFAHWITPEERPLRFDTRFFAAEMMPGQEAVADEREIVAVRWLAPAEAREACRRGEISLRLPTLTNLMLFDGAASTVEALRRLDGRRVSMVRPRLVTERGSQRAILPGEPGYY